METETIQQEIKDISKGGCHITRSRLERHAGVPTIPMREQSRGNYQDCQDIQGIVEIRKMKTGRLHGCKWKTVVSILTWTLK